ncbi:hypothetical protein ANCCAN_03164 [Ancylostoma caninum]|uniref:Cytochrome b561 domain-containing protein n=1 Tax=Ancylostoma caninum TaxID=29170 RepID=A0A368H4U6_ANCCA|nr:hypothetical protein ANCCAN_03164 [Ancylostoma caninum]
MSDATRIWLIKVHGILMVFAWMVLIASAVLSARYLRDHFSKSAPWGLKWWFHIHRTLNIAALPFILISTLLIFIAKDWTWRGPSVNRSSSTNTNPGSVHSLFGTIAILVAVIQPLLALIRCQPDTGARPIFNWSHRILGVTGVVCASEFSHDYDSTEEILEKTGTWKKFDEWMPHEISKKKKTKKVVVVGAPFAQQERTAT